MLQPPVTQDVVLSHNRTGHTNLPIPLPFGKEEQGTKCMTSKRYLTIKWFD